MSKAFQDPKASAPVGFLQVSNIRLCGRIAPKEGEAMPSMSKFIYLIGFSLMAASAVLGHRVAAGNRMDAPFKPAFLNLVTGLSGWLCLAAFPIGIWKFGWLILAYMVLCLILAAPMIAFIAMKRPHAIPSRAILMGLVGIMLSAAGVAWAG